MTTPCSKVHKIEWIDARVSVDGDNLSLPLMTSYGVILRKDKEKILVCSLFGENNEPRVIQIIPSSLVRKIRNI